MAIPANGLIAHYTMDNISGTTLIDETGNYNGTITGADTVPGFAGNALQIDGSDTITSGLVLSGSESIGFWIHIPSSTTGYASIGINGSDYAIEIGPPSAPHIHSYHGAAVIPFANSYFAGKYDDWHHVYLQHISGNVALFIDGVALFSGGATFSTSQQMKLFVYGSGTYKVDRIAIYNRALSSAEILSLYNEDVPPAYEVQGALTQDLVAIIQEVRVYDATSGALVGSTISNATGAYQVDLNSDNPVYVMAIANNGYRPLVHGPITPQEKI